MAALYSSPHGHHDDHEVQHALSLLLSSSVQCLFDTTPLPQYRAEVARASNPASTEDAKRSSNGDKPNGLPANSRDSAGRRENIPPTNMDSQSKSDQFGQTFLEAAFQRLAAWRKAGGRPFDIAAMSVREVAEEKSQIKKELKTFDSQFRKMSGRDPEKADKEVIRSLYLRYNEMKAVLNVHDSTASASSATTSAIKATASRPAAAAAAPAHAAAAGARASTEHTRSASASKGSSHAHAPADDARKPTAAGGGGGGGNGSGSHSATDAKMAAKRVVKSPEPSIATTSGSIDLAALRAEKRALRKALRSFETAFSEKHGRVVQTPADMQPRLQEYQRYKYLRQLLNQHDGKS